jgi:DtxR family Mn-dependent transcriptional regulator
MAGAKLSASLEDYLETIYHIVHRKGAARPKDIVEELGVNSSSVTGALKALAAKGMINYAPYDIVTLTRDGNSVAEDVVRRHEALRDFFIKVLSIQTDTADDAACKMEHAVPREIVDRLIQFAEYVEVCPRGGSRFIEGFGYYCDSGCSVSDCNRCLQDALAGVQQRLSGQDVDRRQPLTIEHLEPGQWGRIESVTGSDTTLKRLRSIGITEGEVVTVERVDPQGDSIEVKVKGYHFELRREEAELILVEKL